MITLIPQVIHIFSVKLKIYFSYIYHKVSAFMRTIQAKLNESDDGLFFCV
jgi:hypothetical protein